MAEGNGGGGSTAIIVALIGTIGVIGAALIGADHNMFTASPPPIESNSPNSSVPVAKPDADPPQQPDHEVPAPTPPPSINLVLHLPQDGSPNNNQAIGPFCCTGTTATVKDSAGNVSGYIYFYDFSDAVNLSGGKDSAAGTVRILVSSQTMNGSINKGALTFDANSWASGAEQTAVVGGLRFTAHLNATTMQMADRVRFDMNNLEATVRVDSAG